MLIQSVHTNSERYIPPLPEGKMHRGAILCNKVFYATCVAGILTLGFGALLGNEVMMGVGGALLFSPYVAPKFWIPHEWPQREN